MPKFYVVRKNRQGGGGSLIASARCEGKCMLTKDVASLAPTVTLESEFDPRANALNAIRLILASGVIRWHKSDGCSRTDDGTATNDSIRCGSFMRWT